MFTLFGWCEILLTTSGEEDQADLEACIAWVRRRIDSAGLADRVDVLGRGGSYVLRATVVQNRARGDLERFQLLLKDLGERAVGSYGLFYTRDDDFALDFRCIALRRGQAEVLDDTVLSPVVPTIED